MSVGCLPASTENAIAMLSHQILYVYATQMEADNARMHRTNNNNNNNKENR